MTVTYDTAYFIERASKVHNNKYDYSQSIYKHSKQKVIIICSEHGGFLQTPNPHLKGQGCPHCAGVARNDIQSFIEKSVKKHGKKYSYKNVVYKNNREKVVIKCLACDKDFNQVAGDHMQGYGCPYCAQNIQLTQKQFVTRSVKAHGDSYCYRKSIYISSHEKVVIGCKTHGEFSQVPADHMRGIGCPKCAFGTLGWSRTGYINLCKNHNGKSTIYIIRCFNENESFYKIGITAVGVKKRFRKSEMPYSYEVVDTFEADAGYIWDLERQVHSLNKANSYTPKITFGGMTECFSEIPAEITRLIKSMDKSKQLQLIA